MVVCDERRDQCWGGPFSDRPARMLTVLTLPVMRQLLKLATRVGLSPQQFVAYPTRDRQTFSF